MSDRPPISESIYSDEHLTIPLADVRYVYKAPNGYIQVVLPGLSDDTVPWLAPEKASGFMAAWLYYRHERDGPFKGPEGATD